MTSHDARPARLPGQAQVGKGQKLTNAVMRALLRAPVVSKGIGQALLLVNVTGRRTGRRYCVPVAYTRHDGALLVGTPFGWARNMRTGEPVEIVLAGRRRQAGVRVVSDEDGVAAAYDVICRHNRRFARFNNIGYGPDGAPSAEDLRQAYRLGARAYVLTPQ